MRVSAIIILFSIFFLQTSFFTLKGEEMNNSIYSLKLNLQDIDKKPVNLSEFKGKVLLIVNVASKCGFTPQYEGLEKLYRKYKDKGFEILAFPCNQFGNQEPGTNEEIKNFCSTKYNVTFRLFDKIDVNGPNTHPLYKFLKEAKPGLMGSKDIKWNFTKFLIDRNGNVVERYAPQTTPESIEKDIEKLLNSK
jgi:glutathione peroxidase